MNSRAVLVFVLFVLWAFAGSFYYLCTLQGICPKWDRQEQIQPMPWHVEPFKLFTWVNSDTLIPGDSFQRGAAELMLRIGAQDTLLIQGIFGRGEENGFTLAFNRASKAKVYFTGRISEDRLRTDIVSREAYPEYMGDTFPAVSLIVVPYSVPAEQATIAVPFEPGTVVKRIDPDLKSRLQDLVTELRSGTEIVKVTGFSYLESTREANYELGRKRAWAVKKLLWDLGLDPDRIQTASRGSEEGPGGSGERVEIEQIDP
ncbi:MAG: OmpA family protein [Flavobacteriales bacterium]|nr:OmpA family protein [Flavobacteriales bacterium]